MAKQTWQIIGHRGNGQGQTENTEKGFRDGLRNGATALEVDVQLHQGKLVCAHGEPPAKPPLLADVLEGIDAPLILHIKRRYFSRKHDRGVIDRVAEMLRIKPHDVTLSSFWPGTIRYAKRHQPKLRTAFITYWPNYDLHLAKRVRADEFHGWYRLVNQQTAKLAKRQKVSLVAFTPPARNTVFQRLRSLGISGVITDHVKWYRNQ